MNHLHTTIKRVALITAFALTTPTWAVEPSRSEMDESHRWAAAKFEGQAIEGTPQPGIVALASYGPLMRNARGAEPLQINWKSYETGLFSHANSKLLVRLPAPAKRFTAEIGIDARAGGGSVIFKVTVADQNAFTSPVMHVDSFPTPIDIDLKGQSEFILETNDNGDGISSDQGEWNDSRITMIDGSTIRLSDLPTVPEKPATISDAPPFSFNYNGQPSSQFLSTWRVERTATDAADSTRHVVTYTDPKTNLQVRCDGVAWKDSPSVEWTIHFKNGGTNDSPLIENVRAIDTQLPHTAEDLFTLRHIRGDRNTADSYEPFVDSIAPNTTKHIANTGGRPTQEAFPYFNLVDGNATPLDGGSGGTIISIGWPGQWSMDIARESAGAVRFSAGQELTHFKLHAGEEVRGPRVLMQFYEGNWVRGQNLFRRWMNLHNSPRPAGKPVPPLQALCPGNYYPGLMTNTKDEISFQQQHIDAGFKFDLWWQDAGWYPCDGVTWPKVGTWEVEPKRYPNGLKEISDFVHAHGMKSILWFEPERVHPETWIANEHPDWVYGGKAGGLLKLGEPKVREWLTDHFDNLMKDQGIDNYRQDFNMDPLPAWRAADEADRQGIAEIRHVEGYLQFWDDLLKRDPNRFIDSCSSGGRRNDIDTMQRSVPLLRSDWYWSPQGQQCQTYGLSMWLPYQGTGVLYSGKSNKDSYWCRSSMLASFNFAPDAGGMAGTDFRTLKRMSEEHRKIADCFLGDYYPLTPYTQSNDVWMAWQFDRPEINQGVVQVFRRSHCLYQSAALKLNGLDPSAKYELTNLETDQTQTLNGRELLDTGLPITMPSPATATAIRYRRIG